MALARVDHELGGHAAPAQRLVELLGVEDGHVPVVLAAHDEGRGGDLVHLVEGADALPVVAVVALPRKPQLGLPLTLVVVVAVVGDVEHFARSGDGALEAVGLGDDVVGEDAAVRPAAHAQAVGVGPALFDGVVDARHHVLEVGVAPVRPQRRREVLSVTRRAARVGAHDHVAVGREELRLELEGVAVLRDGAPMDAQDCGVGAAVLVVGREGDEAFDLDPAFGGKLYVAGFGDVERREEVVVVARDAP